MGRFKNLKNQRAFHAVAVMRLLFAHFFIYEHKNYLVLYKSTSNFEMTNDTSGQMDFMFLIN